MGEWLESTDKRWLEVLQAAPHDFYHTPSYVELGARVEGGTGTAYYAEVGSGRLLIPLLLRSLRGIPGANGTTRDATSPYGYGGPVWTKGMSDSAIRGAIDTFVEDGARSGLVTTFLRLHPLLRPSGSAWRNHENVDVVTRGPTVSVDLSLDEAALTRRVRRDHRRGIARLRETGFSTRFDAWSDYAEFQAAYGQTMERRNAAPLYHFSAAYFTQLRDVLGTGLHLCSVLGPDNDFVAGGLFTQADGIMQYHLSATRDQHTSMAPSKLMLAEARFWARERGARVLHLGGGVGGKPDSLYEFKRGFGTNEHEFETVAIVHAPRTYHDLTDRWLSANGLTGASGAKFFPLYRSSATR